MASQFQQTLHMLFFPLLAPGHMLPMIDIANLFAARGVISTVLTTPANAPLIQPSIDRSPTMIKLRLIPFPSGTGLPEGCENLSTVPTQDLESNFFNALSSLRQPFDLVLRELQPDCLVTDGFLPWTHDTASELNIPRLVFHGQSFFARCASDSIDRFRPYANLPPDAESFVIPGLPHRIEMLKSQMPDIWKMGAFFLELLDRMKETEPRSYGVLVNSFYELEPDYARHYREVVGRRAWCVGPVSLRNQEIVDKLERGNKASIEQDTRLNWLDGKKPGSVVYVSFGSLCIFSKDQLGEIATGLEACGYPFVWVIGKGYDGWEIEGFEERIAGKGLIIRGWAPQIAILGHMAVGGFVTHCGWNSSLEGVSAGLPLVTWPLFAEQFFNEKLIVDVLKVGVAVGSKEYVLKQEERRVIGAEEIERAVRRVMDDGREADERRRRARELGEMARKATEKGGSSYEDMSNLIQELMERRKNAMKEL